jgi:hypothetical protein
LGRPAGNRNVVVVATVVIVFILVVQAAVTVTAVGTVDAIVFQTGIDGGIVGYRGHGWDMTRKCWAFVFLFIVVVVVVLLVVAIIKFAASFIDTRQERGRWGRRRRGRKRG